MKEIIYVKNKERKGIISNVRIKAQKLDQDEYEISRNDCKEFIRIVKRYTIECMFEEHFINKNTKEKEINADDLISIISTKKKRCFYIPIAIYIGKKNELDKYEKYLKKDQNKNEEIKKKDKENLKKQKEIDKKRKEENEMKRYVSIDSILESYEKDKIEKKEVCDHIQKKLSCHKININNNNDNILISTDNDIVKDVDNTSQQEKIEIESDMKENDKTNYKNEQAILSNIKDKSDGNTKDQLYEKLKIENNKKHKNKKNKNKNKNNINQKEDNNENMINDPKNFICNTKNNNHNNNDENFSNKKKITKTKTTTTNIHTTNDNNISEDKKSYYNRLLKKVEDTIERNCMNKNRENKKYLKSFHMVSYYKLNELIYISFLIRKYYNHYYEKELYDMVDTYEDIQNNKKENIHKKDIEQNKIYNKHFTNKDIVNDPNNHTDNNSNIMIHFNKNDNIIYKDIFKKLDEERKQKKNNIYNDYAHKYIHSDMLCNYKFFQNDLYKIIKPVLYNLNIFFNQNVIKDINKIIEKYDTVIQDVHEISRKKESEKRINEGFQQSEGHKLNYEKGDDIKNNVDITMSDINNNGDITMSDIKNNGDITMSDIKNNVDITMSDIKNNVDITQNNVREDTDKNPQPDEILQKNIQKNIHNNDNNINDKKVQKSNKYEVKEKRNYNSTTDDKNKEEEQCINHLDLQKQDDKHITNILNIKNDKVQMNEKRKGNVLLKEDDEDEEENYINKSKKQCDNITSTFKIMDASSKNITNNNLNNLSKRPIRKGVYPLTSYIETESFKVMIIKKKKKKDSYQSTNYNSDSYISSTICDNLKDDNNKSQSDTSINYLNIKYSKEELKTLNNRNFIYYITNDIETLGIYKKIYFYDFFFIYLLRKLFWNIFSLYYLYLQKYNDKREKKKKKMKQKMKQNIINKVLYIPSISPSSSSSYDENNIDTAHKNNSQYKIKKIYSDHLLLYESDISLNNSQINKDYLYNTNKLLHDDLKILFNLIKKQKFLIYFRYDQNKKIKTKNKTQYVHRDIWIYLILKALKKKNDSTIFNEFIFFKEKK
ncbi:conserved Plasmodium protein, unknown function [Plasmodium sp. gorilla clade G2]|uniref:conserved Plasmodium protein, unknown function n=1 Tax=Plasmodium sp. gorilla clade G2 TaxID=880535 RepID=UPI000D206216|nr:conserved Plasmodium protein, unknown function [Plasmodium sp. gorilla clade G2]SOV18936.1 conserved Plasmodium protein, unknown function [Plasmodium sp. gorilla clade G2]